MSQALYDAVKSGKVKLTDLNDAGKQALRGYMDTTPTGSRAQGQVEYQNQMKSAYQSNPDSFRTKPLQGSTPVPIQKNKTGSFADKVQKPNVLDKIFKDNPVMRVINRPFAKMAEMSVPDANYLGTDINAREDFAKRNPILSTGNKTVDKIADVAGGISSLFTPIGTGGAFINDVGKGVSSLLASKSGQVAENVVGKFGAKSANLANPLLNKMGINLSTDLAQKSAQAALRGGTLGAGFGALEPFRMGEGNLSDVPKSVLENAAMFAAGDAALPFLGAGAKALLGKGKIENKFPSYDGVELSRGKESTVPTPQIKSELVQPNVNNFNLLPKHEQKYLDSVQKLDDFWNSPKGTYDKNGNLSFLSNAKEASLMIRKQEAEKALVKMGYTKESINNILKPAATDHRAKIEGLGNSGPMIRNAEKDSPLNVNTSSHEPIKLTPKEQAAQGRIDQFSKIEDNPVIPNTADQIQTKTTRTPTSLTQKANEGYIKTVDNLHRVSQFDNAVEKVLGEKLRPSDSTYKLGLNSRGSDMVSRQIMEKNLVDSKGNIIHQTDAEGNILKDAKGKPMELSLKSVAKAIPKGQQTAFEDYLVAKHSITRMGRGEKVYADRKNMTIQKAQHIVDNYEKDPRFVEAAQKYYQYNQKLGQAWLVDTGILKQEQWDGYLANNPHYVPNNRIFSDLEKTQQFGSKKGFANQTNPVKKAEGSQRQIVSPIESTIENTSKYVKTARQNEVAQTLYRNLKKNPDEFSAWGEIVTDQPKMDVKKMLESDGIEGVLNDIASGFEKKTDLTQGNIVSALVDGERVHMRINDPQLLEAMTNLSPQGQHFIMDNIGKITKMMKVVTTGLNPVFGLTRNIFRDIPMAFVASKTSNNPLVIGKDLLGSIVSIVGDGKLYNAYKNIGGGHSSSVAADRNLLAQTKEKLLPSKGIGQTLKRSLITKPFHALENLNNAVETAPRLGEFKRLQKGTYDSKVKGLYEANDITVNFSKFGNYTKQADSLFPYINAAVQGLDKFVRIYKDNPTTAITKSIAVLTMPTIALYLLNHDNPDYQKLSKYTKDNFLVIPKGDGTFFKIAKPRETGIIFSSAVERAMQAFVEKDPEAFKEFGTTFLTNFLPPGVNGLAKDGLPGVVGDTIAGPIQSLASNKDFLGRPIVSGTLDKLSPSLQYDSKTSEPAKKFGALINYSPKKIDFLIKSYGGIIGQLGIPATTQGSSIKDTLIKQITTDPNFSNDISADFYKAKDKAEMAKADSKVTGEQLTKDLTPMFNKIGDVLSALRKQSNGVQNDSTLSKEEKKKKIDEIQKQTNDIQLNFLKMTK